MHCFAPMVEASQIVAGYPPFVLQMRLHPVSLPQTVSGESNDQKLPQIVPAYSQHFSLIAINNYPERKYC